jgi:DNA polymerase delta subunit 1
MHARVIYGHTDSLFVLLPDAPDAPAAIAAARAAAAAVTAAFPAPMELKFERVCLPFVLLHVNRYAGRAFEREEDALGGGDGGGQLEVKGLKSMWRQSAPLLRTTLHGALVRILMRDDVAGAVAFVEGEVRRLLGGRVEAHELAMTGGLWRVTGEQVGRAAAAADAADAGDAPPSGSGGGGGAAAEGEEVRGPHAALAVRLSRRDPGRSFVLGERLQYVLLAGHKLQDDAAEDPLVAARAGRQADFELYWKHKLQRPLAELFAVCLPPAQLQALLHGPHTLVRVDVVAAPPPSAAAEAQGADKGKAKGGGGGGRAAPRQSGMTQFFRVTAKCLGCRRAMPGARGDPADAPGLCDSCAGQEGRWGEVWVGLLREEAEQAARECAAHAACRQCHSGLVAQPVLCDNAECPVTYARLGTEARVEGARVALRRMDLTF